MNDYLERAARDAAITIATESSRELLKLNQTRAGMTAEAAQQDVNSVVNKAYEKASLTTQSESERFEAVHSALKAEIAGKARRSPLVTEAQSREFQLAATRWAPDRVEISVYGKVRNFDEKILDAMKGR